jgi:hypothetical protein
MKLSFLIAATSAAIVGLSGTALAQGHDVISRQHQTAAPNREAATIYQIRCYSNNRIYYIYQLTDRERPAYRAIIPPYWGNALGGRDWPSYQEAVRVACTN